MLGRGLFTSLPPSAPSRLEIQVATNRARLGVGVGVGVGEGKVAPHEPYLEALEINTYKQNTVL